MKQTIFTLLLLSTIGFVSCRKTGVEPNIAQYDQTQILNYIKANGITGMVQDKDSAGVDTSGIYYKIIQPGIIGLPLTYSDNISFVFSFRSFDGLYSKTDTIGNQYAGYLGHITEDALPIGLELAILNDLKYVGASMRVLIPSQLAYGVNGYGTGSINNPGSHIAGNQCLDYYVHVITSQKYDVISTNSSGYQYMHNTLQDAYDDQVINNFIVANKFTNLYTNDGGVYYRILTAGKGTDSITDNSTIEAQYTGRLLDGTVFDAQNTIYSTTGLDSASFDIPTLTTGVARILKNHAVQGTTISMLIPSGQGYGTVSSTLIPSNSCLRFEFTIQTVSP